MNEGPISTSQTLSQHLSNGRMSVPDVLRYAQMLGDALRKLHESGVVHGAVTPSTIYLTDGGIQLCPVTGEREVTPYTAPEVLAGRVVDTTSDVFSFGAVVYEMLTGRRAFDGANSTELVANIVGAQPAPTGSAAADRLMAICLAKDPAARCQRIQRVLIELRLLHSNGRKRSTLAGPADRQSIDAAATAEYQEHEVRSDLQHLETRLAARITTFEDRIGEIVRAAAENLAVMRSQLTTATVLSAPRAEAVLQDASSDRTVARMQATLNAAMERIGQLEETIARSTERVHAVEEGVAATRKRVNDLHSAVADDFITFEETLKQHSSALESARTAMTQTDDLVERVVDALETIQGGAPLERPQVPVAIIN
jgi:hypothetical protein